MADTPIPMDREVVELAGRMENAEDQIGTLERWRVSIDGLRGDNGKIGSLRAELEKSHKRQERWHKAVIGIAVAAIGALGGVAKYAIGVGEERGDERAQIRQLRRDVLDLRAEIRALRWAPQPTRTP